MLWALRLPVCLTIRSIEFCPIDHRQKISVQCWNAVAPVGSYCVYVRNRIVFMYVSLCLCVCVHICEGACVHVCERVFVCVLFSLLEICCKPGTERVNNGFCWLYWIGEWYFPIWIDLLTYVGVWITEEDWSITWTDMNWWIVLTEENWSITLTNMNWWIEALYGLIRTCGFITLLVPEGVASEDHR